MIRGLRNDEFTIAYAVEAVSRQEIGDGQRRVLAGFQGEPGAFSEEAAQRLLGEVETRGYRTFETLVAAVDNGEVTHGLLPCENTIAGPIARAYDLLSEYASLAIVDETTHAIEQCLIGTAGSTIEGLDRVASHPVAIEQCRRFFARHPHLRIDIADDTAGSVRQIVQNGDPRAGAIGPALAAKRYGGVVLQHCVHDEAENLTRFFLISMRPVPRRALGRACIALTLPHRPGSLYDALGVIAAHGINLRSLVARPNRKRPFEYIFYMEIDAPQGLDVPALAASVDRNARILGRY